jgi:hypothetical protein
MKAHVHPWWEYLLILAPEISFLLLFNHWLNMLR